MKNKILSLAISGLMLSGLSLWAPLRAQSSLSAVQYFQPGYSYRHNFNPALMPQWGYVGFPALGNINANLLSNMGLSDFFYELPDNRLGTFMHPEVSASQFLSKVNKHNYLSVNLDMDILSAGWYWGRSFWNFDVRLRGGAQLDLPYSFFDFLKRGMYDNAVSYDIENLGVKVQSYMEMSVGYARDLGRQLTVGGKFKVLVGLLSGELAVRKMNIEMSEEAWKINSSADFRVYGRLVDVYFGEGGGMPSFRFNEVAPSGGGIAFDLGAEYRPDAVPGLRVSMSLLDLGFLVYNSDNIKNYTAQGEVVFTGVENVGMNTGVMEDVQGLANEFMGLMNFVETPYGKNIADRVSPALNIGVEYGFWGNRFSVGLLSSTVFYPMCPETELTLVANIHPARWFSVSAAYSFLHGRRELGWAVNITPKYGLNFFIASNYTPFEYNPQFIPAVNKVHANLQFGLTCAIGNNRRCTFGAEEHDNNYFPYTYRYPERNRANRYEREAGRQGGSRTDIESGKAGVSKGKRVKGGGSETQEEESEESELVEEVETSAAGAEESVETPAAGAEESVEVPAAGAEESVETPATAGESENSEASESEDE